MYSTRLANRKTYTWKQAVSLFRGGLFCVLTVCILYACGGKDEVVASVDDKELTESEAFILMEHLGYDPKDQEQYKMFLEQWCENTAFFKELEETDPETARLVELRAKNFSGELAQYYLEENLLKQKLDTVVSETEIKAYYDAHKDEFVLSDYLVKALYLKIPESAEYKEEGIQTKYLLKNDKDLSEINSYAKLYAENYYFNDSSWVFFNELAKDIPMTKYNVDNIVLNRSKTYFEDGGYTYFLNIIDFKLKDEAPPVEFLSEQIKEIIVMNRLQKLKERNESKMIQNIKEKHEITVHI